MRTAVDRRRGERSKAWFYYIHILNLERGPYKIMTNAYCAKYGINPEHIYVRRHSLLREIDKRYWDLYFEQKDSQMSIPNFLKSKGLDNKHIRIFQDMSIQIMVAEIKKQKGYEGDIDIDKELLELEKAASINYKDKINENPAMSFINVMDNIKQNKPLEAEKGEHTAHVEIIISPGIKLMVSHDVPAERLIKIIELARKM